MDTYIATIDVKYNAYIQKDYMVKLQHKRKYYIFDLLILQYCKAYLINIVLLLKIITNINVFCVKRNF